MATFVAYNYFLTKNAIKVNLSKKLFQEYFGSSSASIHQFFAPGRVNLIGEHIDYNGGFVFPMAIELGIRAWVRYRQDGQINIRSTQLEDGLNVLLSTETFEPRPSLWKNYPLGVIQYLYTRNQLINKVLGGVDVLLSSNLPIGSGLSSSAALEVLMAYILLWDGKNLCDEQKIAIAQLSQKVENDFVGVQCGIMDQFAVAMGKKDHAIRLNCENLAFQYVPFSISPICKLLILNTNKARSLADSKYNERKEECEEALTVLQKYKNIQTLCEATEQDLVHLTKYPILQQRAKHVIIENQRVIQATQLLAKNDLEGFGKLLYDSHQSLQQDYEVSGFELDCLVDAAMQQEGCLGARMTGAGFGGCAIALVKTDLIPVFKANVKQQYDKQTGLSLSIYETVASNGVHYEGIVKE